MVQGKDINTTSTTNHNSNNDNDDNNPPPPQPPPPPPQPTKVREEGELTSSDDDPLLTASAPPPHPTSVAPSVSPLTSSVPGKLSSVTAVGSTRIQPQKAYRKGFSKNQVPSKTISSGWRVPRANDNLVISFSDDDSGSGSDVEERQREKAIACDKPPLVVNRNKKPPALPHVKMQTGSRAAKYDGKAIPPKVSTSCTFVSSMTKVQESSIRSGVSALAEQKSQLKNSNVAGRSLANPDPGHSKNLDMRSTKLEDLRQQIAARENELKLKLVQQNKENVAETCRDSNIVVQKKVSSRKCKSVPVDIQTQPKEPDRKRLKTNASGVAASCSLSDWNSLPMQTASLMNPAHTDPLERSVSKLPGVISKNQPSRSAPNQDIRDSNMSKANDNCDATSALKKIKSTSAIGVQDRSLQVSNTKFDSTHVPPANTSLLLHLGRSTALTNGDVDLQSLFGVEELHDKELEEAQAHRRICEVEERNALNAYRRAQRALLKANARCTYLYRKRELYSSQLRSYLMEDSSLLYSSRQHQDTEENWNLAHNFSEVNLDLIPSSHQLDDFEAGNQLGYDSNVQSADGDAHNRSSAIEDGHNIGSEACSEPDASTSELLRGSKYVSNGICSPSGDPNFSPDDDYETFTLDQRPFDAIMACTRSNDNSKESEKDMDVDSATNVSKDVSQDPLYLEEYLRSKLISRLGVNSLKRSGNCDNGESSAGKTREGVTTAKTEMIVPSVSHFDSNTCAAPECIDDIKEVEGSQGTISNHLSSTQNLQIEEHNLNDSHTPNPSFNPEECGLFSVDLSSTSIFPSPLIRSVMKAAGSVTLDSVQVMEQYYGSPDACTKEKLCLESDSSAEQLLVCKDFGKIDSYTNKSAVDPFWPLCIYELRGRCNNDECPWQHAKDYSDGDDCQSGLASNCQNPIGQTEVSCALTPPRYLVCLDSLKDESRTHGSLKDCYFGSYGKYIFCRTLAISSSVIKHIPSDEPCLYGRDGCVEVYGGSGHSMYFQSRSCIGNPLRNGLADNDQSLEMALVILSQEINKIEGVKKALVVLSRALETDPSSLPIWIIYLILYYSTKKSSGEIGKDNSIQGEDFFSHAVKHIEVSYELWLLYINSRGCLDERFSAYDRALSRLCYYASSTNDGQQIHRSAAILDLFLQMLYTYCLSGNLAKALKRIHELVHADRDSDESHSLLFSDILQCLTISDKCIFWVCCVYLVVYRKLPDLLVHQFEFEKDVSSIEWPSVHLTVEEKQHVSKLMEMALESVGLLISTKSLETSTTPQSTLPLVVNHIKLTAAIDSVESCKLLLEKYQNPFSSCLEFILMLARVHDFMGDGTSLEKFEELASKWPKSFSGSQCIWTQFAELALKKGKPDRAKEIMDQWFHSDGIAQLLHNRLFDGDDKSMSKDPQSGLNLGDLIPNHSNMDLVFGLLNLSMYRLLHNDVLEAYSAIERALKVSDAEVLMHCVKEHAAFLFNNGSQLMKDISIRGLVDILKGYIIRSGAIVLEPLTRRFAEDIRKPRTRQLLRNILCPLSPDSSWVNSVLEIWFGSSLLPGDFDQLKDMVDYVEAILGVLPANYRFVISVCKLICQDSGNSKSASVLFWACSLLVDTIYHAIPFPPEHVCLEAADLLRKLTCNQEICDSFHQRVLSVYPFSVKLWTSFLNHSAEPSKRSSLVEAAREKGLQLE